MDKNLLHLDCAMTHYNIAQSVRALCVLLSERACVGDKYQNIWMWNDSWNIVLHGEEWPQSGGAVC